MATRTLNIAIDKNLLKEIDKTVKKDMGARSEYFRHLAINDIELRREWEELLDRGREVGRRMGIKSDEQVYEILDDYKRKKQTK